MTRTVSWLFEDLKMPLRHITWIPLILCLWLGPASADPLLRTNVLKPGDRVEMLDDTVVILSDTGIGQVTLRPTEVWPRILRLRFCYSESRGFQRMEGLTISSEVLEMRGTFRDRSQMQFGFRGPSDHSNALDGGTIEVDFQVVNGALELALPPYFVTQHETLKVHWVDVYRD